MRYLAIIAAACSLVACGGGGGGSWEPAAGPALPGALPLDQLVFDSDQSGNFEIYAMRSDGGGVVRLTNDSAHDSWWPRLAPDRRRIVFVRTPRGTHDLDYSQASIWSMDADGRNLTQLRAAGADGWALQGHPEWSPDGRHLVLFGGSGANPQIYITTDTGAVTQRVTDGTGFWLDPSWSPDGRQLVFAGCEASGCGLVPAGYEIHVTPADGTGSPTRLTADSLRDHDPYFSPDGTRIAWLTETQQPSAAYPAGVWNIRMAAADGSNQVPVTSDLEINSKPDWSSDGSLIYFHRLEYDGNPAGFNVYRIRPDGSGLTLLANSMSNSEYPDN